jgi:signal peptidase I
VRGSWTTEDNGHTYKLEDTSGQDVWLRYHHIVPDFDDWFAIDEMVESGEKLPESETFSPSLITDFYAYNAFISLDRFVPREYDPEAGLEVQEDGRVVVAGQRSTVFGSPNLHPHPPAGYHWVGDLALESEVEVLSSDGELLLQLVKAGTSYQCRIDIETGEATLSISDEDAQFVGADGEASNSRSAKTKVKGPGTYTIRYSNVDSEIRLWVNDRRVEFDGRTSYPPRERTRPVATAEDPGDLAPLGVGTRGAELSLKRLRVLRDVYYVAVDRGAPIHEYRNSRDAMQPYAIQEILRDPSSWPYTDLFDSRGTFEFTLKDDQFFPLGDNSPQSSDARMWDNHHYFERELLIGRALLIYWPHPWYRPIPYLPNVKRMRLIH